VARLAEKGIKISETNNKERKSGWSLWISILALLFAGASFIISWRTYTITHRPYVGVTRITETFEGKPRPTRIRRAIVLQNTGSIPARGKVEKRQVRVTVGEKPINVPLKITSGASFFLMPGEASTLYGDFPENDIVPIQKVLSGGAELTDTIRISYGPSGAVWWKTEYFYEANLKLVTGISKPYFTFMGVTAN